jgi:hypothetical protein
MTELPVPYEKCSVSPLTALNLLVPTGTPCTRARDAPISAGLICTGNQLSYQFSAPDHSGCGLPDFGQHWTICGS